MSTDPRGEQVSRRQFIRVAGVGTALPLLLAACGPAAPNAVPPPAAPTVAGANVQPAAAAGAPAAAKPNAVLPTYVPLQNGPKPDYAAAGQQYEDGWDNYPAK